MNTTVVDKTGASLLPYTNVDYSIAINELPAQYGYLNRTGLFALLELLATEYFEINIENNIVTVLPVGRSEARKGGSTGRIFRVPQVEHEDAITAREIKNMMVLSDYGRRPDTLAREMAKKLALLRMKFDLTAEWFRWGALKGIILDGKGNEVVDLFDAFEIEQKVVYFDLGNANSNIKAKCNLLYQLMSQDLTDETMTHVNVECDSSFFEKLTDHPNVKERYASSENALALANIMRKKEDEWQPREFTIGQVTFHENPAIIPLMTGPKRVVDEDTGHAYPAGTRSTFATYGSPPDDINLLDGEDISAEDAAIWITEKIQDHGKGVELLGRMNQLAFCRRPKLLIKCLAGAGTSTIPTAYT